MLHTFLVSKCEFLVAGGHWLGVHILTEIGDMLIQIPDSVEIRHVEVWQKEDCIDPQGYGFLTPGWPPHFCLAVAHGCTPYLYCKQCGGIEGRHYWVNWQSRCWVQLNYSQRTSAQEVIQKRGRLLTTRSCFVYRPPKYKGCAYWNFFLAEGGRLWAIWYFLSNMFTDHWVISLSFWWSCSCNCFTWSPSDSSSFPPSLLHSPFANTVLWAL